MPHCDIAYISRLTEVCQFCFAKRKSPMPQGDKSSYTDKQKRQAKHIAAGYEKKGAGTKIAEARAWATVNKLTGGGKKSGSGRKGH